MNEYQRLADEIEAAERKFRPIRSGSMKKTPYHVHAYPGQLLGKFSYEADALRVAQMWSARWQSWTEVRLTGPIHKGGGLIGQFDKGEPTAEFAHIRAVCHPELP